MDPLRWIDTSIAIDLRSTRLPCIRREQVIGQIQVDLHCCNVDLGVEKVLMNSLEERFYQGSGNLSHRVGLAASCLAIHNKRRAAIVTHVFQQRRCDFVVHNIIRCGWPKHLLKLVLLLVVMLASGRDLVAYASNNKLRVGIGYEILDCGTWFFVT